MKKIALYIGFFALFGPQIAFAESLPCSSTGYTVVYVNGVFDTNAVANADKLVLQKQFGQNLGNEPVKFKLGYNETHLAGAGDLAQSLAQEFSYSVSDYDLQTILMQIYPEVTTRKLLLVGHSQGAYYTGELYKYLLAHGEPKEALAVYDVGTPAPTVAAGGKYLNSSSDLLLSYLRDTFHFNVMPSNIDIPLIGPDIISAWPGHSFTAAYLAGASGRIVSDISGELLELVPTYSSDTGGCFTPPDSTIGYKTQRAIFTIADPASFALREGGVAGFNGVLAVGGGILNGINTAFNFLSDSFPAFTINVTHDSDEKNFKILKQLYGSSLDTPSVKELLGAKQGGAVVLGLTPDEPVPVGDGFVEGTSTGPVVISETSTSTSTTTPAVTASSSPAQIPNTSIQNPNGSASVPPPPPFVDQGIPETTEATTTTEASSTPPQPPAPPSVVINEIEWAGDKVDAGREWIELKNLSDQNVDMSDLSIIAIDGGQQYIKLSGIIQPSGFFIIERDPAAPINPASNIAFDFSTVLQIVPFDQLDDAGEQLALIQVGEWGTTTVDVTPPLSVCAGWCAGSAAGGSSINTATLSMERIDAGSSGAVASNWASNDTYSASPNMPGGNGQPLYATILAENSKHISVDSGWFCAPDSSPIHAGQNYAPPPGSLCTYLARFIPWQTPIWSGIFQGTVGSSTIISLHTTWTGTSNQFIEGIDSSSAQAGDNFFVAIWGLRTGFFPNPPDNENFQSYFTTGHQLTSDSTDPPTDDYRIFPFVYNP